MKASTHLLVGNILTSQDKDCSKLKSRGKSLPLYPKVTNMYLSLLFSTIILVSLAMLGLMLNILVKKKGKFPEYRVGHNRDMHKKGVTCVKHEEIRCHRERMKSEGCGSCC